MPDILTFHGRKRTGVDVNDVNDDCISFRLAISRALALCMQKFLTGTLNDINLKLNSINDIIVIN